MKDLKLVLVSLLMFGCTDNPPPTEGSNPGECSDGADNDSDGRYDCDDADCTGAPDCQEVDDEDPDSGDDGDDPADTGTAAPTDADGDGYLSSVDCDDNDPSSTARNNDADCDGVISCDDCNDNDVTMPNDDMDCDGVATGDDCDDSDPTVTDCVDVIAVFPPADSWPDAQADCVSRGGFLVWIENADVNDAVLDLCLSSPYADSQLCLIGIQAPWATWENGTPVTYTNWHPGPEPDGSGSYGAMWTIAYRGDTSAIGRWDDGFPLGKPYVCRFAFAEGDLSGADGTTNIAY